MTSVQTSEERAKVDLGRREPKDVTGKLTGGTTGRETPKVRKVSVLNELMESNNRTPPTGLLSQSLICIGGDGHLYTREWEQYPLDKEVDHRPSLSLFGISRPLSNQGVGRAEVTGCCKSVSSVRGLQVYRSNTPLTQTPLVFPLIRNPLS